MLRNYFLAVGDLKEPPIRKVVILSVVLALGALVIASGGAIGLVGSIKAVGNAVANGVIGVLGGLAVLALTYLAMPITIMLVAAIFSDRVLRAVEAKHYPDLPPAVDAPIWEEIVAALKLLGLMLALNLLALPLYLIPGVILVLPYAINGYLIGQDWFGQVARRRLSLPEVREAQRRQRLVIWASGAALAVTASIPFVNLLVPVLAPAFMLHQFETLRRNGRL